MSHPRPRGHRISGPLLMPDFTRHWAEASAATIIAIIGTATTVAAAGVGAYAQYQQGQDAAKAGKYNAKVAENQALAAQQAAGLRADTLRDRAARIEATNLARAGGAGIVPTAGSPLFVMADNAMQAELDAQRVQYGGDVEAMGYRSQARLARYGAGQASEAGMFRAGSTLLSGAASASRYYQPGGESGADATRRLGRQPFFFGQSPGE